MHIMSLLYTNAFSNQESQCILTVWVEGHITDAMKKDFSHIFWDDAFTTAACLVNTQDFKHPSRKMTLCHVPGCP